MGATEFLLVFLGWGIPLALAWFVVSSLWRISRSIGSIERELTHISELLERDEASV